MKGHEELHQPLGGRQRGQQQQQQQQQQQMTHKSCNTVRLVLLLLLGVVVVVDGFQSRLDVLVPITTRSTFATTRGKPWLKPCFVVSKQQQQEEEDVSALSSSSSSSNQRKPKRRGRRRNRPKKSTKNQQQQQASSSSTLWRVFGVSVHPDDLTHNSYAKNDTHHMFLEPSVVRSLCQRLRLRYDNDNDKNGTTIKYPKELVHVQVVRRSLDARKTTKGRGNNNTGPLYNFVLDIQVQPFYAPKLQHQPGRLEPLLVVKDNQPTTTNTSTTTTKNDDDDDDEDKKKKEKKKTVIVVGAGPAGLFCALSLARTGRVRPILLERGQPVELRGKDIGGLVHRLRLREDSNFVYGEGGAGTWSDGKLTTRIGRNSHPVRYVLEQLVYSYGAPPSILLEGSPHLGTDNLVRILRHMRHDLLNLGGTIRFGTKMTQLVFANNQTTTTTNNSNHQGVVVVGVQCTNTTTTITSSKTKSSQEEEEVLYGDAVVLATGHSARDVYQSLHKAGVPLEAKGFAVGFRVEHPQSLINEIQYGSEWGPSVRTGKQGTDRINQLHFSNNNNKNDPPHRGRLPVPSYRLATDRANDGSSSSNNETSRGVYSFCMCPGGQIVPATTREDEVCVNGMSFSRRDSLWANAALVVTVRPQDGVLDPYRAEHGVLAGLAFQRDMERRAAVLGGGNFTVPVQRLTDFVAGRPSVSAPSSSYRLGVQPAACHEIYPPPLVRALRDALGRFERQMPGFVSPLGLLHGVETRTSSPIRIPRHSVSLQAVGVEGLFPSGEGAGYAGGIVSAAVDGLAVAEAILDKLNLTTSTSTTSSSSSSLSSTTTERRTKAVGFNY